MDINIRKNSNEEESTNEPSFAKAMEGKENTREQWDARAVKFQDPMPKIGGVDTAIGLPKILNYWRAASRWPLILFAALAPIFFLPFTALPVAANKEILIFILILAAFFALLGRILIEGRIRYPGHLLTASFLVLVLAWGVSSFFSINLIGSLIGSWATADSFAAMFLFVLLALSIVMTFDRRDIVISLLVFLASLSILGVFELLQLMKVFVLPFSFTKNTAFNPIGSVNDLGVLLAFGLILAAGLMSSVEIKGILKRLLGAAVIIFLLNIIVIDFWAIWVGLALSMIFLIGFLSIGLSKSDRSPTSRNFPEVGLQETSDFKQIEYHGLRLVYFQKAWLPSLILLVSLILLFVPSPLARFIETPVEVSPSFRATLDMGLTNLKAGNYLLGSGPNTWGFIYNLYKPEGINQTIFWSTTFNAGASAMASWVGAVGISGILSLLFLIIAFIWTAVTGTSMRNTDKGITNVASQSIFVAVIFMFAMWFLYVTSFTAAAFTFWGIGLFLAASLFFMLETNNVQSSVSNIYDRSKNVFKEIRIFTSAPKTFIFSLIIVALMVGAAVGIYFEVNRYVAEIYLGRAVAASGKGDNEAVINNLNRAVDFWKYDERYYQSLAQATFFRLNAVLTDKNTPQDTLRTQFQNITTNSIIFVQKAASLNPKNPFNAVLLGSIYENLIPFTGGASDFALSSYAAAAALDPKNPVNYLALGRVYIARADLALQSSAREEVGANLDKAVNNLEKAIQLKQDYAPARFLLVQVYDRQGKLPEAIKRAEELVVLNNTDVGALFQLGFLYYKSGSYDNSKAAFELTVKLSPNYSNARYFLGLIYDGSTSLTTSEKKAKALEQFEKIAELNPDNAEIKQIIANLTAKKAALFGIAPPPPQQRTEAPISEKVPVQKIKK